MFKCKGKKILFIFLAVILIVGITSTIYAATYTSKYPEPKTNVKQGASGEYVRWIQDMLNHNGYSLNIDGKFGDNTKNAVMAFQKANKIKVDGIVGSTTRNLLKTKATTSVSNPTTTTKKPTSSTEGLGYDKTIKFGGRSYKVYRQDRYSAYKFWGGTIKSHGCGPTSVAIVASGFGIDVDPVGVTKYMSYGAFIEIEKALKKLGIDYEEDKKVNTSKEAENAVKEIKEALVAGKPVIVLVGKSKTKGIVQNRYTGAGHFMVLLGGKLIDDGNDMDLIIGQPKEDKSQTGTLKNLVYNYMLMSERRDRGYMIITEK